MKKVIRKGIKDIIVDEVPEPSPIPHHVLVRPMFSLISSGTETASIHQQGVIKEVADNPSHISKVLSVMKNTGPLATVREVIAKFSEYASLGYSGAGIVIDKHSTVTDLALGDRVAYGGETTGHSETIITGRNLVVRVPHNVEFQDACFTTLGSIAMNTVRIGGIQIGERVAIIGLGLVGQLVAQLVRLQGGVVIATDLRTDRVELAARLGADHALFGGDSLLQAVLALTDGRGADCVIVAAAAKSAGPCQQALKICRDRGKIVVIGAVEMSFPWNEMYLKEVQLLMARGYGPGSYDPLYEVTGQDYPLPYVRWTENRNMEEFVRLIGTGRVQVRPLVTHILPLDRAPEAYETIMSPGSTSLAVLLEYPDNKLESPATAYKPKHRIDVLAGSKPKGQLGFALAGAGNLARWQHLPNLKKIAGTSLRAIHSSNGTRGKSYALRFGAAYAATDYKQVLDDPDVDVVIITSRNQHHAREALQALQSGKHVFVEKPMALTEQECRDLYRAVQESGRQLSVGFNRRFSAFYTPLKQHLARRTSPAVLQCRINSPGISGSYWMADPGIGGAILGEACHFLDLMYWLLDSEPIRVSAYGLPTGKKDPIGENNIVACFQFADGSIGNLTYCTVGSATSGGERVEVYAPGIGIATEDFKFLEIKGGAKRTRSKMFAEKGYLAQLREFTDALRNGRIPAVTVLDGVRSTMGCLQLMESCRTLTPQKIDIAAVLK
jgi:predicted dehydrogenase/threonine dehydrogenase-like Zn-dependent dehydrogenase